jgi:hypothetical protein
VRDAQFAFFIKNLGEATTRVPVPPAAFDQWKGVLPDRLLTYWADEGWSGYADGLFWLVNPMDYEDLVEAWLAETPVAQADRFHVFARTAFGTLYTWGERTGTSLTIASAIHSLIALNSDLQKPVGDPDRKVRAFFGSKRKSEFDINDERERPMFSRALQRLGPLAPDEMYGFEPALIAGGRMIAETLAKVELHAHLTILREFGPPKIPFAGVRVNL